MKQIRYVSYGIIAVTTIIITINLFAKVHPIREYSKLHDYRSADNPISLIFCYTQPKKLESGIRALIRDAQRGFRDVSNQRVHKKIHTNFASVNLDKVPEIADEFELQRDSTIAYILLFKRGKLQATVPINLEENNAEDSVYKATQEALDTHFSDYIIQLVKAAEEHEKEIALERASAPVVLDTGYYRYGSPWDYFYHGYYSPYWGHRHHRSGFWFGIN